MVVDATLFLWSRCKATFQKVQTGATDSGKYLQKMEHPNKVYILFVSPRERPWSHPPPIPEEDACYRSRNLCALFHITKNPPGLMHKGCVLQRVSLGVQWHHGRSWDETKYSIGINLLHSSLFAGELQNWQANKLGRKIVSKPRILQPLHGYCFAQSV